MKINWGWVFWIGIVSILLWILAKKAGLFNTPFILEVFPYIAAVIVILSVVKEIGKFTHKVDIIFEDIKFIREELHSHDKRLMLLESKL